MYSALSILWLSAGPRRGGVRRRPVRRLLLCGVGLILQRLQRRFVASSVAARGSRGLLQVSLEPV